jgi:hypothetical protein
MPALGASPPVFLRSTPGHRSPAAGSDQLRARQRRDNPLARGRGRPPSPKRSGETCGPNNGNESNNCSGPRRSSSRRPPRRPPPPARRRVVDGPGDIAGRDCRPWRHRRACRDTRSLLAVLACDRGVAAPCILHTVEPSTAHRLYRSLNACTEQHLRTSAGISPTDLRPWDP